MHALGHVLVPLICLYIVCFALLGADAMEASSFSESSSGDYACTQELSSLSADTWEAFAFYFKNMHSATIGPGGLPAAISQIQGFSHFRMPFVCL